LDPAGPLFNIIEPRLSYSDARFVDIIHTDYGFYGIAQATGTVDFFPNNGHRIQPGCFPNTEIYTEAGNIFSQNFETSASHMLHISIITCHFQTFAAITVLGDSTPNL